MVENAPPEAAHLPPESAYFLAVNRNKRSITVNFKAPDGLEIMKKLIQQSDVLVENFVAGKLASMGLGWEVREPSSVQKRFNRTRIRAGLQKNQPSTYLYVNNWFVVSSFIVVLSLHPFRLRPDRPLPASSRLRRRH